MNLKNFKFYLCVFITLGTMCRQSEAAGPIPNLFELPTKLEVIRGTATIALLGCATYGVCVAGDKVAPVARKKITDLRNWRRQKIDDNLFYPTLIGSVAAAILYFTHNKK